MQIPFCKPYISEAEQRNAMKAVSSGWLTTGPITEMVEKMIAEYVGAKYVVLVSSCTAALGLSYQYYKQKYGFKDGFKVLTPALTFAATSTEIVHAGGVPVFGDVNKEMLLVPDGIDYDMVATVHLTGKKASTEYPVPVIEDSAHLFEKDQCKDNPNLVCFSFYATKNLTMGEGGAIATNDEATYNWLKKARHHGISKDGWKRYEVGGEWRYDIEFIGWKCNPSDILASLLSIQIAKADVIEKERKRVVDLYNGFLELKNKGLHLYPVLVEDQDKFIKFMAEKGVQCSVHFQPLHLMTAFKKYKIKQLINTEYFGQHMVSLPLYPDLRNYEIEKICKLTKESGLLLKS